jgi:hypothetical protein
VCPEVHRDSSMSYSGGSGGHSSTRDGDSHDAHHPHRQQHQGSPARPSQIRSASTTHEVDRRVAEDEGRSVAASSSSSARSHVDRRRRDEKRASGSRDERGWSPDARPPPAVATQSAALPEAFRLAWLAEREEEIRRRSEMTRRVCRDDDAAAADERKARLAYEVATREVEKHEAILRVLVERRTTLLQASSLSDF